MIHPYRQSYRPTRRPPEAPRARRRPLGTTDTTNCSHCDSSALTRRENEVLRLLRQGKDNRTIAAELCVSYYTIRTHVLHILEKLEVHSIKQAICLKEA